MRKITEAMVKAFCEGVPMKIGNTEVKVNGAHGDAEAYLHGHLIAYRGFGALNVTLAGWDTLTTRARVNALCTAYNAPTFDRVKGRTEWCGHVVNNPCDFFGMGI